METLSVVEHTYRARWIVTNEGPPIRDGELVVREESGANSIWRDPTILSCRPGRQAARAADLVTDFGDAVIIPVLVNAHTHLEFSQLAGPIGTAKMPFADWINEVVRWRRERDEGWDRARGASPRYAAAIRAGIQESLDSGTMLLGEIATAPESANLMQSAGTAGVAFFELIEWSVAKVSEAIERGRDFLAKRPCDFSGDLLKRGISPHAPYTVHQDLLRAIVHESQQGSFPIAMHLAETEAELELMANCSGPLAELMQAIEGWEPSAVIVHSRPIDYLQILSRAPRTLVIHGNYLDQREIDFLGEHRANMSVVYCPRTHHYFGHRDYPLERMLAAGVRVALGTDSRASNPDLNLWNEVRAAARRHPNIAPEQWLKMATLDGAEALGLDSLYGSLRVGKVGKFAVLPLAADQRENPWSCIEDAQEV